MEGIAGGKYNIVETVCSRRAFRALDGTGTRQYFIKRFDPDDEAFEDEKRNLTGIVSPHMPEFTEAIEETDGKYIVTGWVKGITLEARVNIDGPADTRETGELIIKLCEALSFIHWNRGGSVAFLDLKPSNIMLRNYGGTDAKRLDICLVDFEAARPVGPGSAEPKSVSGTAGGGGTQGGPDPVKRTRRLGSPFYTAPEVLFGRICVQSDIYSVGVIAGFLLTGREDYPSAYNVRGFWGEFIARCTDPDPGKRYANVREVIDAVREELKTGKADERSKRRGADNIVRLRNHGVSGEKKRTPNGRAKAPEDGEAEYCPGPGIFINDELKFRRSCVMVEGNPCFVSEMGTAAASSGLRTGVFSLSERGRRNLDYYFTGHREDLSKVAENSLYPYVFDHKSLYLHGREDWAEKGLLKVSGEGKRLYTGTFKQCLELPLRRSEDVKKFVDWCMANFDLTLMNVERGDEPALINTLLDSCNYVIATPDSNVEDMEALRNYYLTLAESGKLIYSKVRFVAWDYTDREADRNSLFRIVGKDKYLGEVFRSETRNRRKNRAEDAGSVFDDLPGRQYEEILQRLIS